MSIEHKKGYDYHKKIRKYKKGGGNLFNFVFNIIKSVCLFVYKIARSDYTYAFFLGCIHTLIFAPFNLLPVIFISFSGLLFLVGRSHTWGRAFKIGWCFGFGHFTTSLNWIHNALLVDADNFAHMIPFVVIALPAFLAFYFGFIALVTWICKTSKIHRLLVFASMVTICEIIRTYFYLPFPWNLTAHSVAYYDNFLQFSYFIGAFGLTFFLSLIGGVFYLRSKKIALICISALIICMLLGWARIELFKSDESIENYSVRLVQPYNFHHLNDDNKKVEALNNLISLSKFQRPFDLKYIIWPESAYPYIYHDRSERVRYLRHVVPIGGMLLFGADRVEMNKSGGEVKVYNSLIGMDDMGDVLFEYDKAILVPFGEYVPFKSLLKSVSKVVDGIYDFSQGKGSAVVNVHDFPTFTPFICYETIFPFWGGNESDILLDVTNNIWFGDSIGPQQHFAMVKFKAAEVGKPMIRVANSGVSAVVDKTGVLREKINLNEKSFLDIYIPSGKFDLSFYFSKIIFLFFPFLVLFYVFYFEKKLILM